MHKIVALWCHPRSMSTSVERLMRERGDLHCLHEPFMYHYYINQKQREMPYFEPQEGHPVRYQAVRDMIMQKAQTSPVFFKDMAYYIDEDIVGDHEFNNSVTHCFLIREPRAAIASYYHLDKEVTLQEIGYEAQWNVYSYLVDSGSHPIVIQAESIRQDPRSVVAEWWRKIEVENIDSAFGWGSAHPADWDQVKGWHQEAIASTSIRPWSDEEAKKDVVRFEEAATKAPHLRSYLTHHKVFYERLKNECVAACM